MSVINLLLIGRTIFVKSATPKSMKLVKKYPVLGSSVDPEKLSLTIKSLLLALIPVIIAVGRFYQVEIVETDLVQAINTFATIIASIGFIYGILRKYMKN